MYVLNQNSHQIIKQLESAYFQEITKEDIACLNALEQEWQLTKPFENKKILINFHLTSITLVLIRLLLVAGAQIVVTNTTSLVVHDLTLKVIKKSCVEFYYQEDLPKYYLSHYFDLVLDCGGELLKTVTPKIGMVELTKVSSDHYRNISFPVVTVDGSMVKKIEVEFGTGNSIIRFFIDYVTNICSEIKKDFISNSKFSDFYFLSGCLSVDVFFKTKKFLVFGYGKVGKGIVDALKHMGVIAKNICVVEQCFDLCREARLDGCLVFHLANAQRTEVINNALTSSYVAITATGVENAVSNYFEAEDFDHIPLLINMGTYDEYGYKFPADRIINNKKPADFLLKYPTEISYLDPVFALLLRSAEELCVRDYPPGLHNALEHLDRDISLSWSRSHHNEHISLLNQYKKRFDSFVTDIN